MTNKEKYRLFCKNEKKLSIFNKDWWLDAVCGKDNWDVVLIEKGGSIVASLPYYMHTKAGFKLIQMPLLTQTLGPYITYPKNQKYYKRLSWEKELYTALIEQLPKYDSFAMHFSPLVTNWLPFYWAGFKQTTRYTYRIANIDADILENEYETDIRRRRRRKAENNGIFIEEIDSVDDFFTVNKKTFNRKNMQIPYSKAIVQNIYDSCVNHNAVKMLAAKTSDGYIIAVNFLVYDEITVYYLMGGIDPNKKDLGGMDLIQHHSILFALNSGRIFDFEGSMVESIEKYFRSFGAIQTPYFHIQKTNSKLYQIANILKNGFKSV